jgi:2-oxoglutarate ferredoxin oxidoreductase subunit alpha
VHFGAENIFSSGDECDFLVAMNAAALKVSLPSVRKGGTILANTAGFSEKYIRLADYKENPLQNTSLAAYNVVPLDLTRLSSLAVKECGLSTKQSERVKNFFALGMVYWLFSQSLEPTMTWIREKFGKSPNIMEANVCALQAGWNCAENTEVLREQFFVQPSHLQPGRYRSLTGNVAVALGLIAAAQKARLSLFFGGYPITPASDILQTLVQYKRFGVQVFQAEDEIAAITAALGAAFGGSLAATATSGPGMSLKTEAIGLAVMAELPLVIVDVQRVGPSTGMPTKTEQADLYQALYGRHGEAPLPVFAPESPADCFTMSYEAARIALKYRTPVILLSDATLANGSEPFKIPSEEDLPTIPIEFATNAFEFSPYLRDEITSARDWAIPGTKGLEHRIGGLEKDKNTGAVSQDPSNHAEMVKMRANKIVGISRDIKPAKIFGNETGSVLLIGWGSTFGALREATVKLLETGVIAAHLHLRTLYPFQKNFKEVFRKYDYVIVAELNSGQLAHVIQSECAEKVISYTKTTGQPFKAEEITVFVRDFLSHEQAFVTA